MVWLMTRSMLLLFGLVLLLLGLTMGIGQALPPAPVAVSVIVQRGDQGRMTVIALDLQRGGVYRRTLADGRGMFWSENACYVLVPVSENDTQQSALLDVLQGEIRHYPIIGYRLTSWSPDGSRMTLGYTDGDAPALAILDAATGQYVSLIIPPDEVPGQITWSPDSESALMVTGTAVSGFRTYLIHTRTAEFAPLADDDSGRILVQPNWRWSPDSRYIATLRPPSGILVLEAATGNIIRLADVQPFAALADFAWLDSGHQIALFGIPAVGENGAPLNITAGSATVDEGDGLREFPGFLWSPEAGTLQATGSVTTERPPLHWSPDSRRLFDRSEDDTRVIDITDGTELMKILPRRDIMNFRNLWSPDGRYLALSSAHVDGKLRIVDLQTGLVMEQSASDGTLEWSPDGRSFSVYNINSHTLEITRLSDTAAVTQRLPMNGVTRICYPEEAAT